MQFTDTSTAVTLRREMLEVIAHKFPDYDTFDDMQWREVYKDGSAKAIAKAAPTRMFANMSLDDDNMSDDEDIEDWLHFVTDAHQFAGLHIAADEIDVDQVCSAWRDEI